MSRPVPSRLSAVALVVALILAGWVRLPHLAAAEPSELPDLGAAPDFELVTLDGQNVSRASLAGRVAVVNFWATWCPDCMVALPGYIALQERMAGDAGFAFLAISLDEDPAEAVARVVARKGINYPVAMGDPSVAKAFGGIAEIPTTFVIDAEGRIRFRAAGSIPTDRLESMVRALLPTR